MKNRLELFREQIAAFDGAADPARAIANGYIVEEPRQSSTTALFKRISLNPQSKNLLIGGIGSGKTTQLLRIQQSFQQAPEIGIYPHYIDVTRYTKPNDIQVGTLDAIIGLELLTLLGEKGVLDDQSRRVVQEFAFGPIALQHVPAVAGSRSSGVLPSNPHSPDSSNRLAQALSDLVKRFQATFQQTPYFLFDGLDRISEVDKFTRTASPDLQTSEIGFLIVGSNNLLYSSFIDSIDSTFSYIEYRSAFDIENDEEAHAFFEQVLRTRSDKNFLFALVLQDLISLSGGILRDVINLAQESIQEAYLDDAEIVDQKHVERAMFSMGRAKLLGLNSNQYDTLKTLGDRSVSALTSPEETYLLSSGRILEYRFPNRRFALHPVLKPLISQS